MTTVGQIRAYSDIDGWFTPVDKFMFETVLTGQPDLTGTLIELGVYLGRSAVVVGAHRGPQERFVVVDLFGSEDGLGDTEQDDANKRENAYSYRTLSQQKFEENYLALHPELPEVVQGLSSVIVDHVEPQSARFVHIDASHMYDKVAEDIVNVNKLLVPQGVVVLDDYRSPHTPGVAAATWEAIREGGLKPFAISPHKLYGTWGDPAPYVELIRAAGVGNERLSADVHLIREHRIVRLHTPNSVLKADAERARKAREAKAAKAKAAHEAKEKELARQRAAEQSQVLANESRGHRIAREVTPPVVARWIRKRRAG